MQLLWHISRELFLGNLHFFRDSNILISNKYTIWVNRARIFPSKTSSIVYLSISNEIIINNWLIATSIEHSAASHCFSAKKCHFKLINRFPILLMLNSFNLLFLRFALHWRILHLRFRYCFNRFLKTLEIKLLILKTSWGRKVYWYVLSRNNVSILLTQNGQLSITWLPQFWTSIYRRIVKESLCFKSAWLKLSKELHT